jgi:hypothetical protein
VSPQRTLWTDLRTLDQAIVPKLVAAFARTKRGLLGLRASLDGGRGGPAATLRRVDDRFAQRGVLGLVRDVPQAGMVALAALLTAAGIVTAVRLGGTSSADSGSADLPAVTSNIATVGPFPNEPVSSYISAAQASLGQQFSESPRQQTYAIVDFEEGQTPEQVASALPNVSPQLLYVRVRVTGDTKTFPSPLPEFSTYPQLRQPLQVHRLPADASTVFVKLAGSLERAARDNAQFADSIGANASTDELTQKDAQLADARHYRAEAAALRSACACIYAVVVFGPAATLQHIVDSGKVRVIDPASPGLKLSEIRWTPLLPETRSRQPGETAGP